LAYYYGKKHPKYQEVPIYLSGCGPENQSLMEFIFPERNETILLPREFGGGLGEVVFKLAHQQPENEVFWYLNNQFIGTTQQFHELALTPDPGEYVLSVMDEKGSRLEQRISVKLASE